MVDHRKSGIPVKIVEPKEWAAGVPAVLSAYKNISAKVGPLKGSKLLGQLNQLDGFDCPGCAWPDPLGHRSSFEFCENGAKAVADEATLKRIHPAFFAQHSVDWLKQQSDRWLNEQGRLTQPMWLAPGQQYYQAISWDKAFALIATHLSRLQSPDEAAFYTSGRTSNEAAFLYQLMVRKLGTNNLPDCSNMCHESSGTALTQTIGIGKGTVTLEDFDKAELILVFGQNPGSNHPRMLGALQSAKRHGAKIIAINPLDETGLKCFKNPQEVEGVIGSGTPLRDLHLAVKINGDLALLKGLCKYLLDADKAGEPGLDHQFIAQHCHGYAEFSEDIQQLKWSQIETDSGLNRAEIEQLATNIQNSSRIICCWAMGMTQHKNSVAVISLITNLLMLKGSIGKPGAGVCPVRGHSNVQGDRTMGIWEKPSSQFLDRLQQHFDFNVPRKHGVDSVECIQHMADGKIAVFFALGGNFYRAAPDHDVTSTALANCELTVQVSTKLNRSHLFTGKQALILPTLGRTELDLQASGVQTVTVENSMGVVQSSHGKLSPASPQLKSEIAIVAELAHRLFPSQPVDWLALKDDYRLIRDHIEGVVAGFEDYNKRIEADGEFVLPNPVRDSLTFNTVTNKANFIVYNNDYAQIKGEQLLLMTIRSHDQFNTTVYTDDDRYRGVYGSRRVLFMHPDDMKKRKLTQGDRVIITSFAASNPKLTRSISNFQVVCYAIPPGCAAAYYPEVNNLVQLEDVALQSNTPAYKSVIIEVAAFREA